MYFQPLDASNGTSQNYWNEKLYKAAAAGSLNQVLLCKKFGGKIRKYQKDTAFHVAARNGHLNIVNFCIEEKILIDLKGGQGESPLCSAAATNQLKIVEFLIANKAKIDFRDAKSKTPLFHACIHGNLKVFEVLIAKNANLNAIDNIGNTILSVALENNHLEIVNLLLKHFVEIDTQSLIVATKKQMTEVLDLMISDEINLNQPTPEGTLLQIAVRTTNYETIKLLIEKGAHFSLPSAFLDAIDTRNLDIIKLFIAKNVNINVQYRNGMTALMKAITINAIDIVKELIKAGASIELLGKKGDSALIRSLESNESFLFLLENGANPNGIDGFGRLPLIEAIKFGVSKVEQLIQKGVDINRTNLEGDSPLKIALQLNNSEIIQVLIKHNANLYGFDNYFVKYIESNDFDMVRFFVIHGANTNVVCEDGFSLLTRMVDRKQLGMIKFLVSNGIDINRKDANGVFPLSIAARQLSFQIFDLLVKFGGDLDLVSGDLQQVAERNEDFDIYLKSLREEKYFAMTNLDLTLKE